MLALVGRPDLDDREVEQIQGVIVGNGALDELEREIQRLTEEALDALEDVDIVDDARKALVELAHYVAWRER